MHTEYNSEGFTLPAGRYTLRTAHTEESIDIARSRLEYIAAAKSPEIIAAAITAAQDYATAGDNLAAAAAAFTAARSVFNAARDALNPAN